MKPCPFCAEEIQDSAIKCKHCGSMLEQGRPVDNVSSVATDKARIHLLVDPMRILVGLLVAGAAAYGAYHVVAKVGSKWGWLLAAVALVAVALAIMRPYECAYCKRANGVAIYAGNQQCPRCKVLHIIDWE